MNERRFYVVRGFAKKGTVTYNCPTPEWAVRKHRDLVGQGLADIKITGPDGLPAGLADLEGSVTDDAVPRPSVAAHQP